MRLNNKVGAAAVALAVTTAGVTSAQTARGGDPHDGPPPTTSPNATSDRSPDRYDEVGYAAIANDAPQAYVAKVKSMAAGGYAEVTMLDSGRTTLVRSDGEDVAAGTLAWLSPVAAAAIGLDGKAPVRVRRVTPSPADQHALAEGRPPSPRLDAPPSLLAGLRVRLPAGPAMPGRAGQLPRTPFPPAPAPAFVPSAPARSASVRVVRRTTALPTAAPARLGRYVQLAAFASADRAAALARSVGGTVSPAGKLYRVRTGPYPTPAQAAHARDAAAARGYGDARIVRDN